jgi:hypothetical protein
LLFTLFLTNLLYFIVNPSIYLFLLLQLKSHMKENDILVA